MSSLRCMNAMHLCCILIILAILATGGCVMEIEHEESNRLEDPLVIALPAPSTGGDMSVSEAIGKRRSVRDYGDEPVMLAEISQLLWAAKGENAQGLKTAPSAGALYPLEVYIVCGSLPDIDAGVYKYVSKDNTLVQQTTGDIRSALSAACLSQLSVEDAPASVVLSAVFERTTSKYGERGKNYVFMEAGHAAQNVYLQSVALDLGTVCIGAFDDTDVKKLLLMEDGEEPLYVMPVGRLPK